MSMVWLMKCVPLSLITITGKPNHGIMFSYIKKFTTSFVQDSTSSTSSHLFTYSIVVVIYLDVVL